ncbi:S-layer homology domain-containing protein [Chryseomicrobium palamuruense]|uniref:S-layer homology domain-containing protein n=1 Tax=Chryseomicrobium palamuruense TaxID=682973 RepID=A0ABV8UTN6_9BACL
MKKSITQSKVLKATLVGAVAFTPVLAVAPTADAAETSVTYPNVEKFISDLRIAFDSSALTDDDRNALVNAHNEISKHLSNEAQQTIYLQQILKAEVPSEVSKDVVGKLVELLAASTTGVNMQNEFYKFTNQTTEAELNSAFGTSGVKITDWVNFLIAIETKVFNKLGSGQTYSSYYQAFEDSLYDVLAEGNHGPIVAGIAKTINVDAVKPVLQNIVTNSKVPENAADAFVKLAKQYDELQNTSDGGSGGTPVTPPAVVNGELTVDAGTLTTNPQAVIDAINAATTVEEVVITLPAGAEEVEVPATIVAALKAKNADAVIVVEAEAGSFNLPVAEINLAAAATQLGVTQAELSLLVKVEEVTNPLTGQAGLKVLAPAVDFTVALVDAQGKQYVINRFSKPATRALVANGTLNPTTTVAVVVQPNGSYSAVPTFVPAGNTEALFYRNTTSVYTLIENFQTFKDIDGGKSWAEDYVEKLASRMIVKGVNSEEYKPSNFITRGEFAALLSRGLGISAADLNKKVFKDVTTDQAANKNGEVYAAVEAGIIQGYEDGTFRPYDRITRDQAAIMISRAIAYLGDEKVAFNKDKNSSDFKDYTAIGATARPHVERVYEAGYIDGFLDDTFRPGAETNRAQMAKILYNFLQSVKHIN